MSQTLYVGVIIICALYLSLKGTQHYRILTFLLCSWILGGDIIRQEQFDIPLVGLGSKVQIAQAICYALCACLLLGYGRQQRQSSLHPRLPYEKYLFIFFVWFVGVIAYHYYAGDLTVREFRGLAERSLMVLFCYLLLKRISDQNVIEVLGKALILIAALSSVVAIIQFTYNPYFLRVGNALGAFSGRLRSNGVFETEYIHSYVVITGLMLTLLFVKPGTLRRGLLLVLSAGIVFSFHRMSWIITMVLILMYMIIVKRYNAPVLIVAGCASLFCIYVVATEFIPILAQVEDSSFYRERLGNDTMTDRLRFYSMVLDRADQVLFMGAGTKRSEVYSYGMMSLGMGSEWESGSKGGIHNLYLELLFLYGAPLMAFFCMMLLSAMKTLHRLMVRMDRLFFFALSFVVMYALMNLTNSFPITSWFGVLVGIVLGSSAAFGRIVAMSDLRRRIVTA
jgi:hypothetical protein